MVPALSLGYQVCLAVAGVYLVAVLKPSLRILALQLQNVVKWNKEVENANIVFTHFIICWESRKQIRDNA